MNLTTYVIIDQRPGEQKSYLGPAPREEPWKVYAKFQGDVGDTGGWRGQSDPWKRNSASDLGNIWTFLERL